MSADWQSRYGEVVWSKFGSFPWWPSYILDPQKVLSREACKGQAVSSAGKTYTVYFYGDGTLGFITPSNLKPYDEENKAKFAKQKLPKAYLTLFPEAMLIADAEILREKEQRLAWYREEDEVIEEDVDEGDDNHEESKNNEEGEESEGKEEEEEAPVTPVKRKRGRPPKSANTETAKKRLVSSIVLACQPD